MVDFNTKREVTVEKGSGTNRCCSCLNNGMRITRRGRYILCIRCSFYDFLTYFDQEELYEQGSYNTISGLLLDLLEHIPHAGEKVRWNGFSFEVVDMDGARIDKVLVERTEPDFTSEE